MFKSAEYIKSIEHLKDEPTNLPKILLVGRSNVGKSSFINALTNRKNLARTSKTPGKTVYLNYFLIDENFYIVDAPGYGYARRSGEQRDSFITMLENFFLYAKDVLYIFSLIDFKVGPTKDDLELLAFLRDLGKEVIIILTKNDKIPKTKRAGHLKKIKEKLGYHYKMFETSNVDKTNIENVIVYIKGRVEDFYGN